MTWLSRICSSGARTPACRAGTYARACRVARLLSALLVAISLHAGTVSGHISLVGSKQKRVRSARDFSGIVLWLEPAGGERPDVHPRASTMVQKDKSFAPHVLAIPVGSTVEFPNFDPIYHNAFSNYSGQVFDVGLYPPGTTRTVRFRREGIVRVFCNIHPTMSAVIAVLRTPWFDVSTREGAFRIADVPPGEYTLKIFHERATEATLERLERKVSVTADLAVGEIAISEAGYISLPHKNKYGRDYPAGGNDQLPTYGSQK
jgi:plastocyanin